MGNVCSGCCSWVFSSGDEGEQKKRGKPSVLDEENTWFEQDSVPLMSAIHDNTSDTDGVVTKTVVMRSPRSATAARVAPTHSKAASPREPTTPSATTSKSRTGASSAHSSHTTGSERKVVKAPLRGLVCVDKSDDDDSGQQPSKRHESRGHQQASHASSSSSVSSSLSSSLSSSPAVPSSSHRIGQVDAAAGDDDSTPRSLSRHEAGDVDESEQVHSSRSSQGGSGTGGAGDAASSPTSSAKGSSSKPTGPGSPKKARYGRKNYRANSGRKKTE